MRSRRDFLRMASAVPLGFLGLRTCCGASAGEDGLTAASDPSFGYGPLLPDPAGILDLPRGFSYQVISRLGESMDDGLLVPGKHDGMAAFQAGPGRVLIVRNHECEADTPELGAFGRHYERLDRVHPAHLYDRSHDHRPPLGGTTTLVYNAQERRLEGHFLSLAGTLRNCAGGPTPWGTWVSCEETVDRASDRFCVDHGYAFEVPANSASGLVQPRPLRDMGRFRHEAVAVDPRSGVVYETEDLDDGLIYRFLPHRPGALHEGGRLQALRLRGQRACDTRNWTEQNVATGVRLDIDWMDLDQVQAPDDDLRYRGFDAGAARFARGEGMWYGRGTVYFACTTGGASRLGQIWKYTPSAYEGQAEEKDYPGQLELFIESHSPDLIENADNLTVAPWGDVFVCEDGADSQHLVGVTPAGNCYRFARNALNASELAGVTCAPDGSTLFVSIQHSGLTLAIWGPWSRRRVATG